MWEKFLYLICEGLVPVAHIPTQEVSVEMYAIVTTILVFDFLALSSLLLPSTIVTVCFHYFIIWYIMVTDSLILF